MAKVADIRIIIEIKNKKTVNNFKYILKLFTVLRVPSIYLILLIVMLGFTLGVTVMVTFCSLVQPFIVM